DPALRFADGRAFEEALAALQPRRRTPWSVVAAVALLAFLALLALLTLVVAGLALTRQDSPPPPLPASWDEWGPKEIRALDPNDAKQRAHLLALAATEEWYQRLEVAHALARKPSAATIAELEKVLAGGAGPEAEVVAVSFGR